MTRANVDSEIRGTDPVIAERQHWMSVLARAELDDLESYWQSLPQHPDWRCLRKPEIGLAMVRGRTGGTGAAFNLGEVTLTRCVVELDAGVQGFGYVRGRSKRHAELAALLDGVLQLDGDHHRAALIEPLHKRWLSRREQTSRKAAATKVNFMTMVRGS
jgi:alpha-D-ribose 1-methylphosphonate 5-triphosphate synthase subunit PhnG